ncbi:hypothetical protein [Desulfosporosinus nitroreducens]|uniref:hypothetical protein n=1 Tax=Desulfosporosinus nitroreducens TaxID=2018668 RepID=UPI00207C90DE|nr:hypothetical protein [Desulfosporosinus nitroreducens]MCO1604338.1 hypothetical protein [Desulfosporosinus nitroreducens]
MIDESNKVNTINILNFFLGVIIVIFFTYISFWILFGHANRIGALLSLEHFDFDKILLLFGIGISLILSILLWIFLRKTLLKRISILKLSTNLFVVLALLCSISLLTGFLSDQWAKKFTTEKWNTYAYIREDSISDLHSKYKIKGMTKEQMFDLLGSKKMYMKNEDGYDVYHYVVGQFLIATNYFRLYMKDNIVEKFDSYTD